MGRKEALSKYAEAKSKGLVDSDIIPILDIINRSSKYYTTSSCSGRIVVMEIPEIGNKREASFLGKWHSTVNVEDIQMAILKYKSGLLYLLVQSSILHVVAENLEYGKILLNIAKNCGFKYSSIKGISEFGNVLIEILSTEHLAIPLGKDGSLKVCEEDISFFTEIANITLRRIKMKLSCLEKELLNSLPP